MIRTGNIVDSLLEGVQGEVSRAPERIATYAVDFGRRIRREPCVVLKASCEQDIVHALQVSRTFNIPLSMRGVGHSTCGQSLCESGIIVVNLADEADFHLLNNGELVDVSARTTWYTLERGLNQLGRSIPVLPGLLELSVGGTLCVGGCGTRSIWGGVLADMVRRIRLIKPDGTAVWCSPEENSRWFRYSLATLGQIGILERIVLPTIPYRKVTKLFKFRYPTANELLQSLDWLTEWCGDAVDNFELKIAADNRENLVVYGVDYENIGQASLGVTPKPLRQHPAAEVLTAVNMPFLVNRYVVKNELPIAEKDMYLSGDYFLDVDKAAKLVRHFLHVLASNTLAATFFQNVNGMVIRRAAAENMVPFSPTGPGNSPNAMWVGFYFIVSQSDDAGLAAVQAVLKATLAKCVALGGRPYLFTTLGLDETIKYQIYGQSYSELRSLRDELDPQNLLNANGFC